MRSGTIGRPAPARRPAASRLVGTLALFVFCAAVFCAVVGFVLVRQADDARQIERRASLHGAIEALRSADVDLAAIEPRRLADIERIAGLKDLRFETAPGSQDRELHSVLNAQGRIVGWLSWEPDRSLSDALGPLKPLLGATLLFLAGFAGVALWQVRRGMRDLAASERRAWMLAHEDALTGLPNHRKMLELIDEALAARAHGEVVTLAFVDLDGMKDINDGLGHRAGDDLLVAVASRVKELLPAGATCGRFDGDEFALVIAGPDMPSAEAAVEALTSALSRPYWIGGQVAQVGATAGLAHAPRDGQSRDELTRRADLALRAAKRKQRGELMCFVPALDAEFDERRFLERELKRAIADGALDVHYQPIVTGDGARIVGAEALLRWTHPVRGTIAPDVFVRVAEHCGLMAPLGEFVLRRALADARRWPDLFVAVNLSPVQVRDPALVDLVSEVLAENRVAAERLVLEVTEGVLIDNPGEAKVRLDALRGLGARLALDDFGTGYSSLTYLQRFRFDKLKIDKSFVAPLSRARNDQAVVQAIVSLGRALDLTLLAEGVETEEQRVLLRLAGCEQMQGYLFARPGPREALDRLLAEAGGTAGRSRSALRAAG